MEFRLATGFWPGDPSRDSHFESSDFRNHEVLRRFFQIRTRGQPLWETSRERRGSCVLASSELPWNEWVIFLFYFAPIIPKLTSIWYDVLDEEVKAVRVLHSALQNHPQSYALLHVQCDFLRTKDQHEWALKLAKQAVNCAPSEFVTWAKLTEVNMELSRFSDVSFSVRRLLHLTEF